MYGYNDLKKQRHFQLFEELCAIPRGSGNERAVSDYIAAFGKRLGLETRQDAAWNVIIHKPASPGYEAAAPVALQAHVDMVCEKSPDSAHDFSADPIRIVADGAYITAQGDTTLGADNGVGAAYMMAVLEDNTLRHPPIEAIFTTNEETGMDGMVALDTSLLRARRMVNLDSEEEGYLCASCAGGCMYRLAPPLDRRAPAPSARPYLLAVEGLCGGHSGMDICRERANSLILLARLLNRLRGEADVQLSSFGGGSKDNAIPREAYATVWLPPAQQAAAEACVRQMQAVLCQEYAVTEPNLRIRLEPSGDAVAEVLSDRALQLVLSAILLVPNGALSYNPRMPGVLDSSSNLGVVRLEEKQAVLTGLVRSNTNSKIADITERIRLLAKLLDVPFETGSAYPAWEFRQQSGLRGLCDAVYREMCGKPLEVVSTHGGLECALMTEKCPDMDMVSIGPNLHEVHTPKERAEIASLMRVWDYLVALLAEMR